MFVLELTEDEILAILDSLDFSASAGSCLEDREQDYEIIDEIVRQTGIRY